MNTLQKVKQTALNRGLSIEQVADNATKNGVKVSKSTIYTWDTKKPSAEKIKAVADVLGVSVDYLLGNTDDMHTQKTMSSDKLDLREVSDDERYELISAGGKPISDEDWAIIKAVLAKYPRNER